MLVAAWNKHFLLPFLNIKPLCFSTNADVITCNVLKLTIVSFFLDIFTKFLWILQNVIDEEKHQACLFHCLYIIFLVLCKKFEN